MVHQLTEWWQAEKEKQSDARDKKEERAKVKQFLTWRVRVSRLFGAEKGVRVDDKKEDLDTYLDNLSGERLARWYRRVVRRYVSSTGFHAGRLHFYPTFFDRISLEIINPHSRETGAGELPILFESVPEGATGSFTILYVPFDRVSRVEAETRAQVAADLKLIAEGLQAMFCVYGFGAKTSSGFGIARETANGSLTIRATGIEGQKPEAKVKSQSSKPDLPGYLEAPGRLKPEYLNADSTFRERSEAEINQMSKRDRQLYNKAKNWWEREGKQLAEVAASQPEPAEQSPQPVSWPIWTFKNFEELTDRAKEVANKVKEVRREQ
jgi:CRISPR-associated protein Cmr2